MRISDWSSDVCSSDLPVVGPAGRREAITIGRSRQPRFEVYEPDAEAGAFGAQDRARIADRPRHLDPERTVILRGRARRELNATVGRITPLPAGYAQPRRGQPQLAEAHDAIGAVADGRGGHRIASEQIAHAGVEELRRTRADVAGDLEAAARRGLQVHVRVDVEQADAFDAVIIDPPVDGAGVEALVQVRDDYRLSGDARVPP